jgi:osmoprotectant transport system ATP-binding protein
MIELKNISKKFGVKTAVKSISLKVKSGEFCVLIGPSGCGKTTTLKMINRMIETSGGNILIDDRDIKDIDLEKLRRSIGYVIQSIGLFPHMTVGENIATVPKLLKWDKKKIQERTEELLDMLHLQPSVYCDKYPNKLSGGEAQRVGIARALASNPNILLMDEPFGALDPITREKQQIELVRIQTELKKTIVFVTHDIDEAIRLADRVAIMKEGELIQYDTPENILAKPVNKFVSDFIGTDRALKRLSRLYVGDYITPVEVLGVNESVDKVKEMLKDYISLWVVDGNGVFIGWIDRKDDIDSDKSIRNNMTPINIDEFAILDSFTLKEALSRMVWQGVRCLPVIDNDGKIKGEVTIIDILSL